MILVVYGTRPEFIKLFPVIKRLRDMSVPHFVLNTGQHGGVLSELEAELGMEPGLALEVITLGIRDSDLLARLISDISGTVTRIGPTQILSQGDTFTALAASIVAFMKRIPHAHVEAGLRSFDLHRPFPEEFNRRVATLASRLHFVPTALAKNNLLSEGIPADSIHLVGNTIVDMVHHVCSRKSIVSRRDRLVYVTTHRRENWGEPIRMIGKAVHGLCDAYPDHEFIWSLHPNPALERDILESFASVPPNLSIRRSIGYFENLDIIARSALILSDSGGIQEEVACLNKDMLILRDVTERPEVVESGYAILCGNDPVRIRREFDRLIHQNGSPRRTNPFGDGASSVRIVDILKWMDRTGDGKEERG
jgi:UDP-N-acetylglucosamine 2-epimerase (non-hydrolysing)